MNYQTSKCSLLDAASAGVEEHFTAWSNIYDRNFVENSGLKFILRLIWWTLRGLFVWNLGSVIRAIQVIATRKKRFVSYLSITWIMTHWIQSNNRILTITRITWITRVLFISCLDQFCLYFPKSSNSGIARKRKWQKSETYIRNETNKQPVWMATSISHSVAWIVGSPKFICLCINFSHCFNQRINDTFFQIKSL